MHEINNVVWQNVVRVVGCNGLRETGTNLYVAAKSHLVLSTYIYTIYQNLLCKTEQNCDR